MNNNLLFTELLSRTGIRPENPIEQTLLEHPEFQAGCLYGKPRRGHPEGKVIYHIAEVLANVDTFGPAQMRTQLRWISLVHDTFKYQVNHGKPKVGNNHHARIARSFAEAFIPDRDVLLVIETHDDAYNIWSRASRNHQWEKARSEASAFVAQLGNALPLYLAFYECDNRTGDKDQANLEWFRKICKDMKRI
jgi:hypothetical protein